MRRLRVCVVWCEEGGGGLNSKTPELQKLQTRYTGWLKFLRTSIGFDGWRFDYVKGYSGEFARTYIDATVPYMAFGEYWVRAREEKRKKEEREERRWERKNEKRNELNFNLDKKLKFSLGCVRLHRRRLGLQPGRAPPTVRRLSFERESEQKRESEEKTREKNSPRFPFSKKKIRISSSST